MGPGAGADTVAPPQLRFVLATRHDVRLLLHRLRVEGELAEIREPDLRFTLDEARKLFDAAGVRLPGLAPLVERTEGWAAGLRLSIPALIAGVATAHFGLHRTALAYCVAMAALIAVAAGSLMLRSRGPATGQGTS